MSWYEPGNVPPLLRISFYTSICVEHTIRFNYSGAERHPKDGFISKLSFLRWYNTEGKRGNSVNWNLWWVPVTPVPLNFCVVNCGLTLRRDFFLPWQVPCPIWFCRKLLMTPRLAALGWLTAGRHFCLSWCPFPVRLLRIMRSKWSPEFFFNHCNVLFMPLSELPSVNRNQAENHPFQAAPPSFAFLTTAVHQTLNRSLIGPSKLLEMSWSVPHFDRINHCAHSRRVNSTRIRNPTG